ncbi:MAG: galactokinase, partial [Butyricicoccaceae bacterium]
LREVNEAEFLRSIPSLRRQLGDRPVLRAMHFFAENRRAEEERDALDRGNFEKFRQMVRRSGRSSAMYLQNVYTGVNPEKQDMSIALALAENILDGRGAVRVHGGGFAGTIQAFVPNDMLAYFKTTMEAVLGKDACHVLTIRPAGGVVLMN